MSNSAKSVFVFGIYISVLGIAFMTIPNALLGLFGFPATNEVWIRVAGMIRVWPKSVASCRTECKVIAAS